MGYSTKLSSKGQIVVPKSIRVAHGWKAGTEFMVRERENGILLEPRSARKSGSLDRLFGFLPYSGRPKTLKEMDDAITAEAHLRK